MTGPASRAGVRSASAPVSRTDGMSASDSAIPRKNWATITPEFPRAPSNAPLAQRAEAAARPGPGVKASDPGRRSGAAWLVSSRATAAACQVRSRLVPVSPSGTGKTLRASMSCCAAVNSTMALADQSRRSAASRVPAAKDPAGVPAPDCAVTSMASLRRRLVSLTGEPDVRFGSLRAHRVLSVGCRGPSSRRPSRQ